MVKMKTIMRSMSTYLAQIARINVSQPEREITGRRLQEPYGADAVAQIGSALRRISPVVEDLMASVSPATTSGQAEASVVSLPW
jgi:hypothetical protein